MNRNAIVIENAHMHNLRNIDLEIPKGQFVAFCGVSGSGKSSLLFDTVNAEAQRQLIETFSTFARTRLPKLSRPEVDRIRNLAPSIVIDQRPLGHNLRSTVGTATEVLTFLRLLFSRVALPAIGPSFHFSFNHPEGMCPDCHGLGTRIEVDLELLVDRDKSLREGAVDHPECRVGGFLWRELLAIGLFDPDKRLRDYSPRELELLLHTEPIPVEKAHGAGSYLKNWEGIARRLSRLAVEKAAGEEPEGEKDAYARYFRYAPCPSCGGTRINARARSSLIGGRHIGELCALELGELRDFLRGVEGETAKPILAKALVLLDSLCSIGVGYLSLERPVSTLSGGESQRVKLARQLGCDLVDLLYVLDEPSVGLHARDTELLVGMLRRIRDEGNSVLVVEHDAEVVGAADWVIEVGPGAGRDGGRIVFEGSREDYAERAASSAETGLPARERIPGEPQAYLEVRDARARNLRGVSARFPAGRLSCVTGVAGSGKSSLVHECLVPAHPGCVVIDQAPIGRTSRGNLATYSGLFDPIRTLFARSSGEEASLFSFNSRGACPKCRGSGSLAVELFFLDAVRTTCDECGGSRYAPEALAHRFRGKTIAEALELGAVEALELFEEPKIRRGLSLLAEVGLGYARLGQSLSTLSGGEAQRLKIAAELGKEGRTYVLDEPSSGLHPRDVARLIRLLDRLVRAGNTVIVIEHDLDIVAEADWVVDLGPEGGKGGGLLLYEGPVEGLLGVEASHTAKHLAKRLARKGARNAQTAGRASA